MFAALCEPDKQILSCKSNVIVLSAFPLDLFGFEKYTFIPGSGKCSLSFSTRLRGLKLEKLSVAFFSGGERCVNRLTLGRNACEPGYRTSMACSLLCLSFFPWGMITMRECIVW